MDLTFSDPHIWPSILALGLLMVLIVYTLRHQEIPGAPAFVVACGFGFLWVLGSVFEHISVLVETKIFWRKFQILWQIPSATAITVFMLGGRISGYI